jgi:pyruvate dehydrogenase E2 component (dihydrolipoamide acetyltransferase)
MVQSAAVPQFVVFRDLDLEVLAAARGRVSWTALLVAAHATALRGDPALHAVWAGERREPLEHLRVAVAVDTPHGLLAPTLPDPDRMPVAELDRAVGALAARAREGRLSLDDLRPGATTVSNLGGMGVDAFTALLTPPQATALSVGGVGPVPVAVPGGVGTRVRCRVGLAVDHRVADGADAARLLARLQALCDDPAALGLR